MKEKLVTIIIPIYKTEQYLKKCLDSVLNQTYRNLEIILVNDGSPDNCPSICNEYAKLDNRVIVIHQKNQGVSAARNAGLEKMTGEYTAFIDSDDHIQPNYIETLLQFDDDIVIDRPYLKKNHLYIRKGEIVTNYFKNGYSLGGTAGIFFKTSVIKSIRFDEKLPWGEDIVFNLNALKNSSSVSYIPLNGYVITYNEESITKKFVRYYSSELEYDFQMEWTHRIYNEYISVGISCEDADRENNISAGNMLFLMLSNLFKENSPYCKKEKLDKISTIISDNEIKTRVRKNTDHVFKKADILANICYTFNNKYLVYFLYKYLVIKLL